MEDDREVPTKDDKEVLAKDDKEVVGRDDKEVVVKDDKKVAVKDDREVVIDDTTYSLVKLPGKETRLVVAAREQLLGHIDLQTLVRDLGRIGRCIRVAYNGVVAAGPKFTELQIEIQTLGYDVTKLCNKSAVTVSSFKRASSKVLTALRATYGYLLDGYEDMAINTLASVARIAGQMAEEAEKLHVNFEQAADKAKVALENTERAKSEEALRAREKKREAEELEKQHKVQKEVVAKATENVDKANERVQECTSQKDDAIRRLGEEESPLVKFGNGLMNAIFGFKPFGSGEEKSRKYEAVRQSEAQAMEWRKEAEQKRIEAFRKLTEFAILIERCKTEEDFANASAEALHKAMEGLRGLSALMLEAAEFWKQMQKHCQQLSEDDFKQKVIEGKEIHKPDDRRKFWTSGPFKEQAVEFYAGWVALDSVCGEYMEVIKDTQKELYRYIKENPSYEDAKMNVHHLALSFKKETEDAQKALEDKTSSEKKTE